MNTPDVRVAFVELAHFAGFDWATEKHDVVVVDRLTPRLRPPERGECVYFNIEDSEWAIKRVVGLPGEKLAIAGGQIVANGEPVKLPVAPEVKYLARGHLKAGSAVRMAPGHFLVLGDYSADSWDGRFWGGLKADRIEGFARARIWPPSRLGWLQLTRHAPAATPPQAAALPPARSGPSPGTP